MNNVRGGGGGGGGQYSRGDIIHSDNGVVALTFNLITAPKI